MKKKNILDLDDDDEDPELITINQALSKIHESIETLSKNQIVLNQRIEQIQQIAINQNQPFIQLGELTLASPISTIKDLSETAKTLLSDTTIKNYLEVIKKNKLLGGLAAPSYID